MPIYRIYVEKKPRFALEANTLFSKIKADLGLDGIDSLRIIYRYDVCDIDIKDFYKATTCVFSDPVLDIVYDKFPDFSLDEKFFACDATDSQFDADAYTCAKAISVLTGKDAPIVKFAKIYSFKGLVTSDDLNRIKSYIINPLYMKETSLDPLDPRELNFTWPFYSNSEGQVDGFTTMSISELTSVIITHKLEISDDLMLKIQDFFRNTAKRNPTSIELRILNKIITSAKDNEALSYRLNEFEFDSVKEKTAHNKFVQELNVDETKPLSFTISDAINSLKSDSNSKHFIHQYLNDNFANIDPFLSADTSVLEAVYSSLKNNLSAQNGMHFCATVSPYSKTSFTFNPQIENHVAGFSNKIGVPIGLARDIYKPSFSSRPLNIHAYCGIADDNKNSTVNESDKIFILGDAISSKSPYILPEYVSKIADFISTQEIKDLTKKVFAGNLFNEALSAPFGIAVKLNNAIVKDYFDFTIFDDRYLSRIAVCVDKNLADKFVSLAEIFSMQVTEAATVITDNSFVICSDENIVADLPKDFIHSLKTEKNVKVSLKTTKPYDNEIANIKTNWIKVIADANCIAQKGISEMYDSYIGNNGNSITTDNTLSLADFGITYKCDKTDEDIVFANTFVCGEDNLYSAVISSVSEALAKIIAKGGDLQKAEIFAGLGMLGASFESKVASSAYSAILALKDAKDILGFNLSDIKNFALHNLDNASVLSTFALSKQNRKIDFALKKPGDKIVLVAPTTDANGTPDLNSVKQCLVSVASLIASGKAKAVYPISEYGVSEAIAKMCFAGKLGFNFTTEVNRKHLFGSCQGGFLVELENSVSTEFRVIGKVEDVYQINCSTFSLDLLDLETVWISRLNTFYPSTTNFTSVPINKFRYYNENKITSKVKVKEPLVVIPVFTGTIGHKDLKSSFTKHGGKVQFVYIDLSTPETVNASNERFVKVLADAQILALPAGYTGINEPAGNGEMVSVFLKQDTCRTEIEKLLSERDGLILGIGNGFQALVKTGLLPYGKFTDTDANSPTFSQNVIGRHQAKIVKTRVCSNLSPWLSSYRVDDTTTLPVSCSYGRLIINVDTLAQLDESGQVATQYVDYDGMPSTSIRYNPSNSVCAIEAITSPDGRILGKMGHSDRTNDSMIFKNAIEFYK